MQPHDDQFRQKHDHDPPKPPQHLIIVNLEGGKADQEQYHRQYKIKTDIGAQFGKVRCVDIRRCCKIDVGYPGNKDGG